MTKIKGTKLETGDNVGIVMSPRTASHQADREAKNKQGNPTKTFESIEDMEKSFNDTYGHLNEIDQKYMKEKETDKLNGFDIDDKESIMNFDLEYTPMGSTLIVKFLREDELGSKSIIIDVTSKIKKALVVQPGIFVDYLKKGDIVSLVPSRTTRSPLPDHAPHLFKGVSFQEINYEAIAGIYMREKDLKARSLADRKKAKLEEGA